MAQQESSNDLPVIVGAIVVGLIAVGIFFFMRKEPVPAPTPAEPVRAPLNAQAVTPRMIETNSEAAPPQGGGQQAGGGGGLVGAPGGGAPGGGAPGGQRGPTIAAANSAG
jgi:hypothetical protein